MSNFSKSAMRKSEISKKKLTTKHVKAFYKILNEMDILAKQLDPQVEYTEDNINDYAKPIYGRDLDPMEKMLVLGKLHHAKENNKEKHI